MLPARNALACEAGGGDGFWIYQVLSTHIEYPVSRDILYYIIVGCKDSFIKILIPVYPG